MTELVGRFGTSVHRCGLLKNLLDYRALLYKEGYTFGAQFVDGSFVEDVENLRGTDPADIDVWSLVSAPYRYQNDPALWQSQGKPFWDQEIVDRQRNKARYSLDTYGILVEELNSAHAWVTATVYWYSLFSHQRRTFAWKGFALVPLNADDDVVARADLMRRP